VRGDMHGLIELCLPFVFVAASFLIAGPA